MTGVSLAVNPYVQIRSPRPDLQPYVHSVRLVRLRRTVRLRATSRSRDTTSTGGLLANRHLRHQLGSHATRATCLSVEVALARRCLEFGGKVAKQVPILGEAGGGARGPGLGLMWTMIRTGASSAETMRPDACTATIPLSTPTSTRSATTSSTPSASSPSLFASTDESDVRH